MEKWYKEDLAYIHDVGFSDYAVKSASGILEILAENKIRSGLIVDLGCGSGLSAQKFIQAGYRVLGIDISESLIEVARKRVPEAEFEVRSLFKAKLPNCNVITSIGECLNYLFDEDNNSQTLINLFQRIYNALTPGGMLIFDLAEPGQVKAGITKGFTEGEDWIVLVEKEEDREQKILTRRIITFRKIGEQYRRDDEIHYQKLCQATEIASALRQIGFHVQVVRSYGNFQLPKAHVAFIACKLV
ncbi:MAG: class I SAM-dependent methyltransferase [Oscillatoria sp. PMC 1051.18]|nr:class I SAM-dependent methyltransferase [Oscillatoria sp. PMC 1050.18]MEC5031172.1 class I SAM-dependent methyltransferase [Oscillatoria sp. PMC 1051.18]